jgi:multidrug transporter EmrE-like cation transporter
MNSQTWPIILNLIASLFGAFGQYFYKLGSQRLKDVPLFLNWQLAVGAISFTAVMVLFVISFKMGGKISTTFPVYASTFIWGTMIGIFIEKESFHNIQWLGVALVVVGITLVSAFSEA